MQEHLDSAAAKLTRHLDNDDWKCGGSDSLDSIKELAGQKRPKFPQPKTELLILKEEFVALRCLMFMRYVFRHLRNLLGYIIAAFILSVVSISWYPFQGHRWSGVASAVTFLALGIGIASVFAQMDRDAILSRIAATKADEIGRSFYIRLLRFGTLSLLTVLASQFPAVNRILFSWVQPALEALK